MSQENRKIAMLIDDDTLANYINSRLIERHLQSKPILYTDAKSALSQIRVWNNTDVKLLPSLIFLDIEMPIMNGWEFLEEFKKLPDTVLKKCKIIMLTTSIDEDDVKRAKSYDSVIDFISKPLTVHHFNELFKIWNKVIFADR